MSTGRDVERAIRDWLEDGLDQLPDRYLDAALDEVSATDQRRHSWLAWRPLEMSSLTRTAIAAVAVLVLAVVVVAAVSNGNNTGSPGASPTGEPTATPVASVAAGMQQVTASAFVEPFTVTVPTDWNSGFTDPYKVGTYTGSSDTGFWGLDVYAGVRLYADPCHPSQGFLTTGEEESVRNLAAHLRSRPGITVSELVDYTSPGHDGSQLDWQYSGDATGCEQPDNGVLVWAWNLTHHDLGINNGYHLRWFMTEVHGKVVVISAWAGDDSLPDRMADLQPIVDSITFE